MFDRTIVLPPRTRTEYVTREVHEHRAPTDESVKLLREMEQAAEAKRIGAMQMPDNAFHGVVEVADSFADGQVSALAVFTINGKRLTAKVTADAFGETNRLFVNLRDEVAKVIASEVLIGMTSGLKWPSRRFAA